VTYWLFVVRYFGSHVRVTVRAGEAPRDRALCGELTMTPVEWSRMSDALTAGLPPALLEIQLLA